MKIKVGDNEVDTADIAVLYKESVLTSNDTILESSFYTTIVRALNLAEEVGLYNFNAGNRYWDFLIKTFVRILRSDKSQKVRKHFTAVYVYILLSELWCVLDEYGHTFENIKEVEHFKKELPRLFEAIDAGQFLPLAINNGAGVSRKIDEYKRRYQSALREHRERELLRDEIYSVLNKERSNFKSFTNNVSLELKNLGDEIDKTKSDIGKVKSGGSFLIGWAGIENLIKSLQKDRRRAEATRYIMMGLVIASLIYLVATLKTEYFNNLLGLKLSVSQDKSLDISSTMANSSIYYFVVTFKSLLVNVIVLSCSLYFYKVALFDERRLNEMVRELEFKSAITAFQEPNLERVRNAGGNVPESIERYEEFLYERWESPHNEKIKNNDAKPLSLEDKKDCLSALRSIINK